MEALYACFDERVGICSDSRLLKSGQIFFALKGDHFNGHTFAVKSLSEGASAIVLDEKVEGIDLGDPRVFQVEDVIQTLQDLAAHHRKIWGKPIIALTGSNGKTTVKELFASVLKQKFNLHATKGNFNNHLGVPFTLLQLRSEHTLAVIELGANHQGEIQTLAEIAQPNVGYITNFGRAHLEGFGGPEGVIKGKTELYRYLRAHDGLCLVNPDDPIQTSHAGPGSFPFPPSLQTKSTPDGWMTIGDGVHTVQSHLSGAFQGTNLKAAWAIGLHLGLPPRDICKGIEQYVPRNNRGELKKTERNTLFLDAYNANPSSMEVSLRHAATLFPDMPHIYIAGDLFELGTYSAEEHQRMVEILKELDATEVWLVGNAFKATNHPTSFRSFATTSEAIQFMQTQKLTGAFIWIKGSRGMTLEQLVPLL